MKITIRWLSISIETEPEGRRPVELPAAKEKVARQQRPMITPQLQGYELPDELHDGEWTVFS